MTIAIGGVKIRRMLPLRLTVQAKTARMDKKREAEWVRRVRRTFARHHPPIHVGEFVGSGGFSRVFKAASDYDGVTEFAIKVLRPELLEISKTKKTDPAREQMRVKDIKKRFTNESYVQWALCQNLSDRISQSVVRVFDHGEFDAKNRFRFILLERMGSTLRDHISQSAGQGSDREQLAYKTLLMSKIANIIFNVHMEGIIHRDIKPENIFFCRSDDATVRSFSWAARRKYEREVRVKLGDFGTVRWVKTYSHKFDGVIIGSQWYLAPEQILNPEHLDTRADIYSFGVVCYELLHGAHPKNVNPHTRGFLEKLAWAQPQKRTPPRGYEGLNDIITKCLAPIHRRYQSMGNVLGDLRTFSRTVEALRE